MNKKNKKIKKKMGNETSTEDLGPIKSSYSTLNLNNKKLLTNLIYNYEKICIEFILK